MISTAISSSYVKLSARFVYTGAKLWPCVCLYLPVTSRYRVETTGRMDRAGARFTKYLTTILRLSYDNAEVTIDLRRTSNLQNILRRTQRLFLGTIHLQYRKRVFVN